MNRTTRLRQILNSPDLEFLLEAHNGVSARIVEEAGFPGIWASGLSIAAQLGVRDSNEASWTQVLEVLEFMADAATVPILVDGDTGHGDFNTARRFVQKLEQRGIAGVCFEDKTFPKTNSLLRGGTQVLADPTEFCGKIKAALDARRDPDFVVIARVEAFVAGHELAEALARAAQYHDAGADGIFIHSALRLPDQVLAFKQAWGTRAPVVIAPTMYYGTPTDVFHEHGFSIVLWANHMVRASLKAMQETAAVIRRDASVQSVEDRIAPVAEIFRLQGVDELAAARQRYAPAQSQSGRAIILAAARSEPLAALTADRPKTMIPIGGRPILARIVDAIRSAGLQRVTVVRGYQKDAVALAGLEYVDNDDFETTGELVSLQRALDAAPDDTDTLVCYGDVLFHKFVAAMLFDVPDDLVVAVDTNPQSPSRRSGARDYVVCSEAPSTSVFGRRVHVRCMTNDGAQSIHGEWMGLLKVRANMLPAARAALAQLLDDQANRGAHMSRLVNELIASGHSVRALYHTGDWADVDTLADLEDATSLF